jgi:hypothetical protein
MTCAPIVIVSESDTCLHHEIREELTVITQPIIPFEDYAGLILFWDEPVG